MNAIWLRAPPPPQHVVASRGGAYGAYDSAGTDALMEAAASAAAPRGHVVGGPASARAAATGQARRACGCCSRSLAAHKVVVFTLTFLCYVALHVTRKTFSVIKSSLSDEEWFKGTNTGSKLGLLDSLFLFAYAFGLYFGGSLGDRFPTIKVLVTGMWLAATVTALFGVGGYLGIHSLAYYAALWGINGLVQSVGWPTTVAVMGNWFGRGERGAVMGVWSGNASTGNIVGTGITAALSALFGNEDGWKLSMIAGGAVLFTVGFVSLFVLKSNPVKAGFPDPNALQPSEDPELRGLLNSGAGGGGDDDDDIDGEGSGGGGVSGIDRRDDTVSADSSRVAATMVDADEKPPIRFWRAWTIPGVIPYALSYSCLKASNYALFFWAPLFLSDSYPDISDARIDLISMLYDLGQVLGGVAAGYISDRMGVRSPITVAMMVIAASFMYFFNGASLGVVMVLLFLTGFMMGGPANMISATVSADLGTHPLLLNNARALSTVTGIIDGTGSVGAAFVQFLVGWLRDHFVDCRKLASGRQHCTHWDPIFIMMITCNVLACLCLSGLVRRDLRTRALRQRNQG